MKEFRDIVSFYNKIDFKTRRAALVTVVKVRGSAYRGPGARMLITDDGKWCGAVTGGCLEVTALRKSFHAIHKNEVQIITFNSMDEENDAIDYRSGCNGIVELLVEPIDHTNINNPVSVLKNCLSFNDIGVVATVIRSNDAKLASPGQRVVLTPGMMIENNSFNEELFPLAEKDIHKVFYSKLSGVYSYSKGNSTVDIFIEIMQPSVNLLIFGSGKDVRPLTQLADFLGWSVSVIDKCITQTNRSNFPDASQVINCQAGELRKKIKIASLTAAVLMSHNYDYDLEILQQLLNTDVSYIGVMGSLKKTEKMFQDMSLNGPGSGNRDPRIHTPVGLAIGAETANEIAISIITEIMANFTGNSGRSLKKETGFIHKRNTHGDEVCKLVYADISDQ